MTSRWFCYVEGFPSERCLLLHWTRCSVRTDCLSYVVKTNQLWGIWGGLNTKERRKVRKERAA